MGRRGKAAVAAVTALWVGLASAGGAPSGAAADDASVDLQVVANLQVAPGNITLSPDGRIFISQHQFFNPQYRVVEVMGDGTTRPFPNPQWASAPGADGVGMQAVLGLRATPDGIVWMLDNGSTPPKLVGWDLGNDTLHRVIPIPEPASIKGSFLNDFAVDPVNGAIYIADFADAPEKAALVVVELASGEARRVLQGDRSTRPEGVPIVVENRHVRLRKGDGTDAEPRIGVNPITIDVEYQWVYFGAMNGNTLWRARTTDLINDGLSPAELSARVERFGHKPVSDGISIDSGGGVYITDLGEGGIGVTIEGGSYRVLVADQQKLSWPDAISGGPDGRMYVAVNQLHKSPPLNGGVNGATPPFYIVSFQPLSPAAVGR